jgi:uncharacterized protein YecE (DUF72 family)
MTKIYVGTSGYAYKEWKGKFYPEKISPKEMLRFYSGRLNTVEINNTFYRMPKESILTSWAEQVPGDFVFALKAPQVITHLKQLRDISEEAEYLFRTISVLNRKLGPVLFQFPRSFRADRAALENLLARIPSDVACAFEFRNPTWLNDEILDLLRKKGSSLCIADTDENRVQEIVSTAPWGYLRLRRSDYTDADLTQWMERILSQEWERAFVFFKHEDEDPVRGPQMAVRFQEMIDSRVGKGETGKIRKAA